MSAIFYAQGHDPASPNCNLAEKVPIDFIFDSRMFAAMRGRQWGVVRPDPMNLKQAMVCSSDCIIGGHNESLPKWNDKFLNKFATVDVIRTLKGVNLTCINKKSRIGIKWK